MSAFIFKGNPNAPSLMTPSSIRATYTPPFGVLLYQLNKESSAL